MKRGIADVGAQMGQESALPWFAKYVQDERAKQFHYAFPPLAKSNPSLARTLAARVLGFRKDLTASQKHALQRYTR